MSLESAQNTGLSLSSTQKENARSVDCELLTSRVIMPLRIPTDETQDPAVDRSAKISLARAPILLLCVIYLSNKSGD